MTEFTEYGLLENKRAKQQRTFEKGQLSPMCWVPDSGCATEKKIQIVFPKGSGTSEGGKPRGQPKACGSRVRNKGVRDSTLG